MRENETYHCDQNLASESKHSPFQKLLLNRKRAHTPSVYMYPFRVQESGEGCTGTDENEGGQKRSCLGFKEREMREFHPLAMAMVMPMMMMMMMMMMTTTMMMIVRNQKMPKKKKKKKSSAKSERSQLRIILVRISVSVLCAGGGEAISVNKHKNIRFIIINTL